VVSVPIIYSSGRHKHVLHELFITKSIETVKNCQEYIDFSLPSVLWAKRVAKFEVSFECFLSVL